MLNGFDISKFNAGIDIGAVPSNFVIVQHSCGSYVEPTFEAQVGTVLSTGRLLGLYHFVTGAPGEIDTFINGVSRYRGRALIALDWETGDGLNTRWGDWNYLKEFAQAIQSRLGVNPLLYASASLYPELLALGNSLNCGLWVAQYATNNPTGYQEAPWNEGRYNMALYQYSDAGRLSGWGGDLDLDLFYGGADAWDAYARSSIEPSETDRRIAAMTPLDLIQLNANKDTIPTGMKVIIANTAKEGLYLTSHDGGLEMTSDPMPWYVQRNADQSISLADPWGNWITVPSDVKNGDLPSVVRGNGSSEQRWMASPYQGGVKFTTLIDNAMCLDLPLDRDEAGQRVQVWGAWTNNDACPNQTWKVEEWHSPAPEAKPSKPEMKPEEKAPVIVHDAHTEAEQRTAESAFKPVPTSAPEPKAEAPKTQPKTAEKPLPADKPEGTKPEAKEEKVNDADTKNDREARIIADLKDLSDISKSEDAEVGDEIAGMVEAIFHTKKATKKMANWIFIIGAVLALCSTVLLILSGCHILPASGGAIAGIVSAVFSAFAHAMGISIVKTK